MHHTVCLNCMSERPSKWSFVVFAASSGVFEELFFLLQGFKRFSCRLPWTPSRLMAMQGSHRCTHTLDLPTGAKRILRTSALYKSLSEKGFPHRPQFPLSGRERTPWQRQQGSDEGIHKGSISLFYNYQDADDILVVGFGNQMLVGKKQQWQIGINTPLC